MTNNKPEQSEKASELMTAKEATETTENSVTTIDSTTKEVNQLVSEATSIEQTESPEEKLKKYQILHIDDDVQILRIIPRVFRDQILKFSSFTKAEELIKALEEAESPTIIISDNNFGGSMNGLELAVQTYELRKQKKIPFIIFCDPPHNNEEWKNKFDELLAIGVIDTSLRKPSTPIEIRDAVKNSI